jgi:hypothetical protein
LETARLRSIQHPRRSKGLLASFTRRGAEHVWIAFTDYHRIWFFTATPSLDLSRERGRPVLEIRSYDEQGDLLESACWVYTRDEEWVRCA